MSVWSRLKGALGATQAEPADAEELFTSEVEAALRALPNVGAVTRGADFSLSVETGGEPRRIFLRNVFAETRDLPATDRAARIRRFVSVLSQSGGDDPPWSEVGDRLVPVLRPATSFQALSDDPDLVPIRRRFLPFLNECVGLDSEQSFQFVNRKQVARWGVDVATVFEATRDNGALCFDGSDVARLPGESPSPMWHVARDDSYESSRLLLPGWLASFAGKVAGRPVAIVPSRSKLVVGGDGDERGLRHLLDTARREYEDSTRRISPALYTVGERGAVVPLSLPSEHPLAAEVAIGHVTLAVGEYAQQQQYLQGLLGDDVFVASCTGLRGADGTVFTYTTWAKDVPSLLPRADRIAFAGEADEEIIYVPWQTAVDLVGGCLCLEPGQDPPRWRTDRWPDAVTIEKLRAATLR